MSELKADKTFVFGEECDAYKKSEADKVIAEKDEEIAKLREYVDEFQKATDSAWCKVSAMYDVICHYKYKRCLAMAEWCGLKRIDAADYRIPREKWEFYDKWHERWLELAEKFKPNKEAK